MRLLLTVTTVAEGVTGLALLVAPSVTIPLLLGVELNSGAGYVIARVAGSALLALAIACWRTRNAEGVASTAIVAAMLFYNAATALILIYAFVGLGLQSSLTWPVILAHSVMGAWCGAVLWFTRTN